VVRQGAPCALVVEDDALVRRAVGALLLREGFRVVEAADGGAGLVAAAAHTPDVIVLDVMLPDLDGFEVVRRLRRYSSVPILMLTALATEGDLVRGLEGGADDYLTKPYSGRELLARLRALLRREELTDGPTGVLDLGRLTIDLGRRSVALDGVEARLTPTELRFLSLLAARPGDPVSPRALIGAMRGYEPSVAEAQAAAAVLVNRLRRKLEPDPRTPVYLRWAGTGYALGPPPA
jgi:two-component system KDP operon response regulator KdpE